MYDEKYFRWQKEIGKFGGKAELFKFKRYVNSMHNVIDFGCGGGFLLANLDCREKIGVEINEYARMQAHELKLNVYSSISEIPDKWADCVISNHALEHVDDPLNTLINLKSKMKSGAIFICVVPHEIGEIVSEKDCNHHLFTWSPQNLKNLFKRAGYDVNVAKRLYHSWPKHFFCVHRILGWKMFNAICFTKSFLFRTGCQTVVVGVNKDD